jgi:hypothetical protein
MANRAKQPLFTGVPGDYQTFCENFELFWESLGGRSLRTIDKNCMFSKIVWIRPMHKFARPGCFRTARNEIFPTPNFEANWTENMNCG